MRLTYHLTISGQMTSCPAYLGIKVIDRADLEELFRYDVIVFCPPTLNLTFSIPASGSQEGKSFEVVLDDATVEHRIFLTYIFDQTSSSAGTSDSHVDSHVVPSYRIRFFVFVVSSAVFSTIICLFAYIGRIFSTRKKRRGSHKFENANGFVPESPAIKVSSPSAAGRKRFNRILFPVFVVMKVTYNFLFTFSGFIVVFALLFRNPIDHLLNMDKFQSDRLDASMDMIQSAEEYLGKEFGKQFKMAESMRSACQR